MKDNTTHYPVLDRPSGMGFIVGCACGVRFMSQNPDDEWAKHLAEIPSVPIRAELAERDRPIVQAERCPIPECTVIIDHIHIVSNGVCGCQRGGYCIGPPCPRYNAMAAGRIFKSDHVRIDRGDWTRASGEVSCVICGCLYHDHAPVQGVPWLKRMCDGRLVKL